MLEILMLVGGCFVLSLMLYLAVTLLGRTLVDEYCFQNDIVLDEFELYEMDNTVLLVSFVLSVAFFIILFFALFGDRLSYIRQITAGVHSLQNGDYGKRVDLVGNNELTGLAEAINYLSESEQRIKEKEKRLNEEKEELIRTLSHDIRTPLTSIISYTELLEAKGTLTDEEQREYFDLISKKTAQIKELTDILLDGGRRQLECFEDARLLFEQLVDEFESELEGKFTLQTERSMTVAFSGKFDVGELRRIFDNLISNIVKYAEQTETVKLSVSAGNDGVVIRQCNGIKKDRRLSESYKMGINSIRRIAQNYGGSVAVSEEEGGFTIIITLSDI